MMKFLFLLQIDWQKLRPENLLGGQVLERTPAALSLIYMAGIALLVVLLIMSFFRNLRPKFAFERDLPKEVKRKLSMTATNRSLRIWHIVFILLAFFVYGFHVYWAAFAEKDNQRFQELSTRDLRYRRSTSAQLRGWMFDRSGKLANVLAYYKREQDGDIVRSFPLDREMAQLLGTELGSPGLERTLYKQAAEPMPEAWEVLTKIKKADEGQTDVRITIDKDLQTYIAQQLQGKKGAIVVLNPQTGDVLAIYSNPSFALSDIKSIDDMHRLERDNMNKPLLSRALREYYVPGSTFKTLTMMSAFRSGKQDLLLPDRASSADPPCYTPYPKSRPICDAGGSCEICNDAVPIKQAYTVSSNQYFSQLANAVGRPGMGETAGLTGIAAVETPADSLKQGYYPDIWNTSNKRIAGAIAPARSTMVTGSKITLYDFGLEGMGQGLAGQMTPFQMALIASIPANMEGKLMKPKIEFDQPPQPYAQVISPQQAAMIRDIMATVTEESGGTATRVFARMSGTGIRVGGKTGSAEKDYPVFDQNGNVKTETRKRKDSKGNIVEYQKVITKEQTDSWFICIAPLGPEEAPEAPQVAIAVVVENGGMGATTAAPIAVNVIMKARELGLLGEKYKPKVVTPPTPVKPKKKGK